MKKTAAFSFLIVANLLIISCKHNSTKTENKTGNDLTLKLFSKNVGDSFTISVMLPNGYNEQAKDKYPVIYILDGNLYFDIMATAINKYSEVEMAPRVIVVGVGYKDFITMDSLRDRDYSWPVAIPEYEMSNSGGADKFLRFINEELTTAIDKKYRTDTSNRILMGHSLGGYFVVYALFQTLSGHSKSFNSYISASPSMHYNHYCLLNEMKKLSMQKTNAPRLKAYACFGGLEDEEDGDEPGIMKVTELSRELEKLFSGKYSGEVDFKTDIFSNLGHMETPYPGFMKGLQMTFADSGGQ